MDTLGELVDFRGAAAPGPVVLTGSHVRLEPMEPARHGPELFAETRSDRLYDYLPYGPFADVDGLRAQLDEQEADPATLTFAICDVGSGLAVGMFSFLRVRPADGSIEVGNLLGSSLGRTTAATEAFSLLAHHVFDDLGCRRYEWKCNALNAGSMRAARRLGFVAEGVFRQDRVIKGRNRDTAWFSMVDGEWPAVGSAYRSWLDPANFDDGMQVRTLEEIRADLTR